MFHGHRYGVSLFSPTGLPDRVRVCGRSYRATSVTTRSDGALREVGTFAPPLHEPMEVLGRPDLPACGMQVFVGPDDGHLTEFTLMGGP